MRDETLEWIKGRPIEQLQCRDLRHAWPREQTQTGARARSLRSSENIKWQVITKAADGSPRELTREMGCTGRCGLVRVEDFFVRPDGSIQRNGKPRYRPPPGYLRKRASDEPLLEPLDTNALRGIIVHRLYPKLAW